MMHKQHRSQTGFTLVELLIVVTIIGILASIAYPSYQEYIRSSRRTAAMGCVMEQTHFMERFYSGNMTYVGAVPPACPGEVTNFYNVATANLGAATYTISAAPTGAQASDRCGTLSINHLGVRSTNPQADNCWR